MFVVTEGDFQLSTSRLRCLLTIMLQCFVLDESTGEETLIASFKRKNIFVRRKQSHIDLYPGYENSLDLILCQYNFFKLNYYPC